MDINYHCSHSLQCIVCGPSALEYSQFVRQVIYEFLASTCVFEMPSGPHIRSPLSVVVNTEGRKLPVVSLRYVLRKDSFKY